MRTYRPKISALLTITFIAVMMTGFAAFIAVMGWQRAFPGNPWVSYLPLALVALLILTFGLYFTYGALFCSAAIETDDDGITRRAFWGTRRLLWRDLTRFEVSGTSADDFALFDRNGVRLDVNPSILQDGDELLVDLQERIAPIREAMLREWKSSGAVLRTVGVYGPVGWICLALCIALCFSGAYSLSFIPILSPGDQFIKLFAVSMCVVFGLLLIWGGLHSARRFVRLTSHAIEVSTLTFHARIPYSEIQSVATRQVQTKETSQTLVTVRGTGKKKIVLNGTTPNLPLILEFLRERAGATAALAGVEETRAVEEKQKASTARFLLFASPIYVGLLLGMPLWLQHRAQERLDDYYFIRRQGRTAEATVVDKTTSGSKRTEYLVEYTFAAPGSAQPIRSASPVDYDKWERTAIGSKLTAFYLPAKPRECSLQISARGEISKGEIRESYFYLVFGAVGAAVFLGAIYSLHMRRIGRWKDPEPPSGTAHLAPDQVRKMKTELQIIGLARIVGVWVGSGSMALLLLMMLVLLLLSPLVPALKADMNSHHSSKALNFVMLIPAICALGGWFVLAPLGEFYAYLRMRRLEKDIADPRLASQLVTALQRSITMEKSLAGPTSLRLLNALTVVLAEPRALELSAKQRSFLYQQLIKQHTVEARRLFCRALIPAILVWQEKPGLAALRTVAASQQPDLREMAARSLDSLQPG